MTLRTDLAEVNGLSKGATFWGPDLESDGHTGSVIVNTDHQFYRAAIKLFREHGDSIEQLIDMALTIDKYKQGREL